MTSPPLRSRLPAVLPESLKIDDENVGINAWRSVAACAVELRALRRSWRCDCSGRTCDAKPGPAQVLGEDWSHCPYPILRSPAWAAIVELERSMDLGAPREWPLGLAAWVVAGVYGLRLARKSGNMSQGSSGGGVADQLLDQLRRR